jgi:hypothetical protein
MKNPSSYMARVVIRQPFASACLLVALATPALGQAPAFDIVGGGTDPSTGNVHVSIPLFPRPWMAASLEINSHMYIGGAYTEYQWNGGFTNSIYGYAGIFPQAVSGIEYGVAPEVTIPESGACTTTQEYFVSDPSGSQHPLPSSFWACLGGSGTQTLLPSVSTTTDGSGITVTTTGYAVSAIYDKAGNKYTSSVTYVNTGNNGSQPVYSYTRTDQLGNKATRTYDSSDATWTWTDQAGNAFLTEKHNQGSNNTPGDVYTYTDGNATTETVTVNYASATAGNTKINCSGIAEMPEQTVYLPTTITIEPAGATYSFVWARSQSSSLAGKDGHLQQITYPNRSYVKYTYDGYNNNNIEVTCAGVVGYLTVTSSPDGSTQNSVYYSNNFTSAGQNNFTVTATNSTDNSKVVTSYSSVVDVNIPATAGWPFPGQFATKKQVYQGSTLLETSINCYDGYSLANPLNCVAPTGSNIPTNPSASTEVTSFENHDGMASTTTNKVNDTYDSYGNHLVHEIFNWGTWGGSALTATTMQYVDSVSCGVNSSTSYIFNRPCSIVIGDGSGNNYRSKSYTYSPTGLLLTSKVQLTSTPTYLSATYGNYTTAGVPLSVSVTGGGTTTLTTTLAYADCNGFGLTKVTAAVSTAGNTQQAWDCNGGVITSVTDPNGNAVDVSYLDPFYRLTKITYPDDHTNDKDTFTYSSPSTFPPTVDATSALTPSTYIAVNRTYDGFGHLTAVNTSDPNNTSGGACPAGSACVNYGYNGLYQLTSVTNPFYGTGDPTYGVAYYYYDALSRKYKITRADGTVVNLLNSYI